MDEPPNGWGTWSRAPFIRELQKETPGGHCVFCRKRLQPSRTREKYVCYGADCRTAYNTEYQMERRRKVGGLKTTQRGRPRKSQNPRWLQCYEGDSPGGHT